MVIWLIVFLSGGLGALMRFGINQWIPFSLGQFPWATFFVNALGAFLIGLGYALIVEKVSLSEYWRHALMVGFLGGFTTFSTFALETLLMITQGYLSLGIAYLMVSVVVCLIFAAIGLSLGRFV